MSVWIQYLYTSPDALVDFQNYLAQQIQLAQIDMDKAIEENNLQKAASAKGRRDAFQLQLHHVMAPAQEEQAHALSQRQ